MAIFLLVLLLALLLGGCGYLLLAQLKHAALLVDVHLKDIAAVLHRRVDYCAEMQSALMPLMPTEHQVWQELDQARHVLLRAMADHQANLLAEAEAEFNRCLFDLEQRLHMTPQLSEEASVSAFRGDLQLLQQQLNEQVERYNGYVQRYNRLVRCFPHQVVASLAKMRRRQLFMHEPATVNDTHLDAVVLE